MQEFRSAGLWGAVVLIAVIMAVPASATPGASAPLTPSGAHDLASDPSGFPVAKYSNPQIEPDPAVPSTTPVVLNLTSYGTVALPVGTWETVVMNYTGYTGGTAYDYFQTVTIDGAMVYVGVNPEAGHWTELVNLTEFLAFFDGQSSMSISGPALGAGTNFEGVQDNWITFLFYPIPAGGTGPSYANEIEPLFQFNGDPASAAITIPKDASAVVLQMIAIGSEFWYTEDPDFTAVTVAIGSHDVASYLQYPWINSGGIDLFSWRPIYPVNMLNHQWEYFNLTGALGLIEGHKTLTASAPSGSLGADVIANLLIYTNPQVTGAKSTGYHFDQGNVQTFDVVNSSYDGDNANGNSYAIYDQADTVQYGYASTVATATGSYSVNLATTETYENYQAINFVWENITGSETTATTQTTTYQETGLTGTVTATQTLVYPLAMNLGATIAYLYTQGQNTFYNYTSYFYDVNVGYQENDQTVAHLDGITTSSSLALNEMIERTNGTFVSVLEIGPGYAIITAISSSLHTTTKVYSLTTDERGPGVNQKTYYYHLLSGREDNSTTYYVQEKISRNVIETRSSGGPLGALAIRSILSG